MHTSNVNRKDYAFKESHHHAIIEQSLYVFINYIQSPRWTRRFGPNATDWRSHWLVDSQYSRFYAVGSVRYETSGVYQH